MSPPCPTRDELDSFQAGDLEETALASVSAHVEGCPNCQRSLETIIGDSSDTVLQALLAEPEPSPFVNEAVCRFAIERVAAIAAEVAPDAEKFAPTVALELGPNPADDVLPLETIREYKLLAKLGEGGMGAVYKALHTRLDKVVALKVLPQGRMKDGGSVARFQREMKAVGRLDHPNIVRAMDAGEEEGTHFLVMEYVEGADLSLLSKNVGPLPVADACELVRQAAIGLQEAHEHGMVHRDIKPSNLILARPSRKKSPPTLKILDLGLALLAEALAPDQGLTSTGQMMGTIDYMAPEQGSDTHRVDIRADIYSLGATLYRLLTGSAPFAGVKFDTPVKKILALATKEPAAVQTLRADIPPALAAIVHKMLAKDPAERFATPEELADALAPFCLGTNLAALLERGTRTGQPKTSGEAPTHPQVSSGSVDTAPTIDRSIKRVTKPKLPSRTGLAELGHKISCPVAIAAACGGAALAVLLGVVIYLQTSQGTTIRIEIIDPAIKVTIDEKSATFEGIDKEHQIKVEPGKHGLTITRDGFKFTTDKFELRKGETVRLSVKYLEGEVRVVREDGSSLKVVSAAQAASPSSASAGAATNYELDLSAAVGQVRPHVKLPGEFAKEGPFTVEMFATLRVASGTKNRALFMKVADRAGQPSTVALVQTAPAAWQWQVHADGQEKNKVDSAAQFRSVQAGQRTHLAGVFTGTDLRLFVNGRLAATTPSSGPFDRQAGTCMIGLSETWANWLPFDGLVDEVRLSTSARYDRDFMPAERLAPDTQTWALYHCDERAGDSLVDSSGNGRHGKIVGAKWAQSAGQTKDQALLWHAWPTDAPAPAIAPFDATQARKHQEEWADYLKVPVEYENSIGMRFVLIPPGEFMLGSPAAEVDELVKAWDANDTRGPVCIKSATPQHKVILTRPMYASVHEVTQKNYQAVIGSNPSVFAKTGESKELAKKVAGMVTADFSVDSVSWLDATDFCSTLSRREKLKSCYDRVENKVTLREANGYRLPSEAEWEFSCRAGSTTPYCFGELNEDLPKAGWFGGNSGGRRHTVGELQANPFGLHDLHGNAWEWVQDWWEPSYPEPTKGVPAVNPQNESLTGKSERVLRGGNWRGIASLCRSSFRDARDFWHRHQDYGFRVWLSTDAVKAAIAEREAKPDQLVDLLKLVDVERDSVKGKWTRTADGLASNAGVPYCRLKLPYAPPPEYDFRVEFTAQGGNDILQLFTAGGRSCTWLMGAWGGKHDGFDTVKEHPLTREGTNIIGGPTSVHRGQRHTSVIQVRRDSIAATIDGKLVVRHATDGSDLGIPGDWSIGEGAIGLGTTFDAVVFHKVELVVPATSHKDSGWHGWPKDAPPPAIAPFTAKQARKHQEEWADFLKVPIEYENSIGMKFALIPPGEFTMGSTETEIDAALKAPNSNEWARDFVRGESPKHKVILTQPIYLGIHEVTQKQFELVTGGNPSHFSPRGAGKNDFGGGDRADCPVECIRWIDAAEFCIKLSQHEKLKPFYLPSGETVSPAEGTAYRLPTEAQWEFACRAGTTTRYWTGDKDEDLLQAAWFKQNAAGLPHAVGLLKPNPFGLYDVHGNIWECVHDWWEPGYYGQFQEKPAVDPRGPVSPATARMLRGGNWSFGASDCRSSGRLGNEPAPPYRSTGIGFRVALPVIAVQPVIKDQGAN